MSTLRFTALSKLLRKAFWAVSAATSQRLVNLGLGTHKS